MCLIYHVHTLVMHAKDTDIIGILVATTNTTDEPTVCLTEMENFQTKNAKQPNNFITVSYRHRPALIVFLSFVSSSHRSFVGRLRCRCCSRSCSRRSFPYLNPFSLNMKSQHCYLQSQPPHRKQPKARLFTCAFAICIVAVFAVVQRIRKKKRTNTHAHGSRRRCHRPPEKKTDITL